MNKWPAARKIKKSLKQASPWWQQFCGKHIQAVMDAPYNREDCPWLIIYNGEEFGEFVGIPLLCPECGKPMHTTAKGVKELSAALEGFEISLIKYINPGDLRKPDGALGADQVSGDLARTLFGATFTQAPPAQNTQPIIVLFLEKYEDLEINSEEAGSPLGESDTGDPGAESEDWAEMIDIDYDPEPDDDEMLVLHPDSLLGIRIFSLDDMYV